MSVIPTSPTPLLTLEEFAKNYPPASSLEVDPNTAAEVSEVFGLATFGESVEKTVEVVQNSYLSNLMPSIPSSLVCGTAAAGAAAAYGLWHLYQSPAESLPVEIEEQKKQIKQQAETEISKAKAVLADPKASDVEKQKAKTAIGEIKKKRNDALQKLIQTATEEAKKSREQAVELEKKLRETVENEMGAKKSIDPVPKPPLDEAMTATVYDADTSSVLKFLIDGKPFYYKITVKEGDKEIPLGESNLAKNKEDILLIKANVYKALQATLIDKVVSPAKKEKGKAVPEKKEKMPAQNMTLSLSQKGQTAYCTNANNENTRAETGISEEHWAYMQSLGKQAITVSQTDQMAVLAELATINRKYAQPKPKPSNIFESYTQKAYSNITSWATKKAQNHIPAWALPAHLRPKPKASDTEIFKSLGDAGEKIKQAKTAHETLKAFITDTATTPDHVREKKKELENLQKELRDKIEELKKLKEYRPPLLEKIDALEDEEEKALRKELFEKAVSFETDSKIRYIEKFVTGLEEDIKALNRFLQLSDTSTKEHKIATSADKSLKELADMLKLFSSSEFKQKSFSCAAGQGFRDRFDAKLIELRQASSQLSTLQKELGDAAVFDLKAKQEEIHKAIQQAQAIYKANDPLYKPNKTT